MVRSVRWCSCEGWRGLRRLRRRQAGEIDHKLARMERVRAEEIVYETVVEDWCYVRLSTTNGDVRRYARKICLLWPIPSPMVLYR